MRKLDSKSTQKEQQESTASTLESGKQQIRSPKVKGDETSQCLDEVSNDLNTKEVIYLLNIFGKRI